MGAGVTEKVEHNKMNAKNIGILLLFYFISLHFTSFYSTLFYKHNDDTNFSFSLLYCLCFYFVFLLFFYSILPPTAIVFGPLIYETDVLHMHQKMIMIVQTLVEDQASSSPSLFSTPASLLRSRSSPRSRFF